MPPSRPIRFMPSIADRRAIHAAETLRLTATGSRRRSIRNAAPLRQTSAMGPIGGMCIDHQRRRCRAAPARAADAGGAQRDDRAAITATTHARPPTLAKRPPAPRRSGWSTMPLTASTTPWRSAPLMPLPCWARMPVGDADHRLLDAVEDGVDGQGDPRDGRGTTGHVAQQQPDRRRPSAGRGRRRRSGPPASGRRRRRSRRRSRSPPIGCCVSSAGERQRSPDQEALACGGGGIMRSLGRGCGPRASRRRRARRMGARRRRLRGCRQRGCGHPYPARLGRRGRRRQDALMWAVGRPAGPPLRSAR